ncbi:prenyltransferase/squalene oxidase repeat-containing protein [Pseudogracilibacillus sp. SO30301A]|uniref:prenyltransferase/squalene oxidase repeat-containing protein n=1 Tax=Pseudogracilibacillus sp. SO30301A TaxID=3098291 RepID=UPI00300DC5ED
MNREFITQNSLLHWLNKIIILILAIFLTFPSFRSVTIADTNDVKELDSDLFLELIEGIIQWKKMTINTNINAPLLNNTFLENAGETTGDWYPLGMGRSGYEDDYESYLAVIREVVEKRYKQENKLSDSKATEWHRISLAILASGGDPTNMGNDSSGKPINLIAEGTYNRGKTRSLGAQGLNGWIWGLITLDSMRYFVPEKAYDTRQSMIIEILKMQLTDGGFSLSKSTSDPDMTAMAIQALAPYYNSEESYTYHQKARDKQVTKKVRDVINEAVETLSELQLDGGDFESWETPNSESTAQVIVALTSLGIDPLKDERFIKNGNTVIHGISKYMMEDGGFIHSESFDPKNPSSLPDESNTMASEQVMYALVALVRYYENFRTLYDFREEMDNDLKKQIESIKQSIETIPDDPHEADIHLIKQIFNDYLNVPIEERSYVFNYYKLADAMEKLGIENTSEPITEHIGINKEGKGTIVSLFDNGKIHASDIVFTENDAVSVSNLPDKITTEYYVDVVTYIEKLEHASNKGDYEQLLDELTDKKKKIEEIENEIELINQAILDYLYPFSDIGIKDKEKVDDIVKRYEALSTYDRQKIQNYEDVEKAETEINSLIRARYIMIGVCLIIIVVGFFYIKHIRKRRREKLQQKMIED